MKKRDFIVEVDVDGVLADMDGSYGKYVNHIIPNFNEKEHVKGWGVPNLKVEYPEAYKIITSLYTNPEFIGGLPRYPGVEIYLNQICRLVEDFNGGVVVHTHIFNEECAEKRDKWLRDLKVDSDADFEIDICVGSKKKTRDDSYIIIEDNIRNLSLSSAPNKLLMRRGHNRDSCLNDIGFYNNGYIIKDLSNVTKIIKSIIETEKFR